jgi:hypothetical protein
MCEPVSMGIMTAMAVAGAATSAYGQVKQGQFQQAVANQQAEAQDAAATAELEKGAAVAGETRMKGSMAVGEARATAGGGGVDLSSGSPLDAISDSRMMNELDAQRASNDAVKQAWGYKTGAAVSRAQGQASSTAAGYGAAGTLLGAGAQTAGMWANWQGGRRGAGLSLGVNGGGTTAGAVAPG